MIFLYYKIIERKRSIAVNQMIKDIAILYKKKTINGEELMIPTELLLIDPDGIIIEGSKNKRNISEYPQFVMPERYGEKVKIFGKQVTFDEAFINRYAYEAHNLNTGARGLETIRNGLRNLSLEDIIFNSEKEQIELNEELFEVLKKSATRSAKK